MVATFYLKINALEIKHTFESKIWYIVFKIKRIRAMVLMTCCMAKLRV